MKDLRCNIPENIFETWQTLKRRGDAAAIAKDLEVDKNKIYRALVYGNVRGIKLVEQINNWFIKRQAKEEKITEKFISKFDTTSN